jgi:hypothetical protein
MENQKIDLAIYHAGPAMVAGWLLLGAGLFFAVRRPAANVFVTLPSVGMGGVHLIAGLTYGRVSALVGLLTVLGLVLRKRQKGEVRFADLTRTPLAWFAGVCLIISFKIVVETMIYGLDASRAANLTVGLTSMVFPCVTLILSELFVGTKRSARDLHLGMVTFPVLMMVGYLPFAFTEGQLEAAFSGLRQLTIGSSDSINSASVFTYGAIGTILLWTFRRKSSRPVALAACLIPVAVGFIVLLLLTGTRQYMLGMIGFLLLWGFAVQSARAWQLLATLVVLACFGVFLSNLVNTHGYALKERLSGDKLATDGRLDIWTDVLESIVAHPALGTGFKNFGEECEISDKYGTVIVSRNSAHGVWQDVFAEHGVPLGLAFLAGCIHMVVRSWMVIRRMGRSLAENALILGLLALLLPRLFSGGFLNSTVIYVLLIMVMALDASRTARRINHSVRGRRHGVRGSAHASNGGDQPLSITSNVIG